jgi:hypothetical protein
MSRTKDFYLLLLEIALIEMRAAPAEGNPDLAPKIADMFHNVPGALRLPWTQERDEGIYSQLRAKAEVYGLPEALDRWERYAFNRIARDAQEAAVAEKPETPGKTVTAK